MAEVSRARHQSALIAATCKWCAFWSGGIATRIQVIEALMATHRAALAELDALFASLQQRAFSGKLQTYLIGYN